MAYVARHDMPADSPLRARLGYLGDTLCVLALLTRPEGVGVVALAIGFRLVTGGWRGALAMLVATVAYFAWKQIYFGDVLPSPYYAKGSRWRLSEGWPRLGLLLWLVGVHLPLALAALAGLARAVRRLRLDAGFACFLALVFLIYPATRGYYVLMDDAFRLYVPAIPLLAVCAVWGLGHVALTWRAVLLPALLTVLIGTRDARTFWIDDSNWGVLKYNISGSDVATGMSQGHIALGKWLGEHAPPGASIALHDAGAVPYFSRMHAIDIWSLTIPELVANRALWERHEITREEFEGTVGKYLLAAPPDFILQDYGTITADPQAHGYRRLDVAFGAEGRPLSLWQRCGDTVPCIAPTTQ